MNIRSFRRRTALCLSALIFAGLLSGCSDSEVADVSLGFLTFKNIKLDAFVDEKIPGVTSPSRDLSIASIIAGVMSPVWRQEMALSEGSASVSGDSMLAT